MLAAYPDDRNSRFRCAFISTNVEIYLAPEKLFYISRIMKMIPCPHLSLETAAAQFAALGSEQRLSVLNALVRAGADGLTMGDLGESTSITGSTLTHHLKILAAAGLVTQTKRGRSMICAGADYPVIQALSDYLLQNCCADMPSQKECSDE
jgi:DNA-binding transcriptional ArsR family regulator